uniref:Uncharacterized protein n=1 Tax=Parascaris univalens TaxID=6257 RepID=A0A915B9R3_PARUN
ELRELSREEISEMIESFENIRRPRAHLGASLLQEIDQKSSSKEELIARRSVEFNATILGFRTGSSSRKSNRFCSSP